MKTTNILSIVYDSINDMTHNFRTVIESECNWSTPTFYRKIRKGNTNSPIEEKMALKIAQIQAQSLLDLIEDQKKILDQKMIPYPSHLQNRLSAQSTLHDENSPFKTK